MLLTRVCLLTHSCGLCADISSLVTHQEGSGPCHMHAAAAGMAAVMCIQTQQTENYAALTHAAVQSAAFLQGHGKLDGLPGHCKELLSDYVVMMLTNHLSSYVKPGGYSEQGFKMLIKSC